MPDGNSSCLGLMLGVEKGLLRVDRCCRSCSTQEEVLVEGICEGLDRCMGLGM